MQVIGRKALIGEILSRAASCLEFRQLLLADPYRAMREEFGVALPPSFRIRFIEREESLDALIVLPALQRVDP